MGNHEQFHEFIASNQLRVNGLINKILLNCILVGPAIAIGVCAGAFPGITYLTCASLVGLCVILYLTHTLCLKYTPTSGVTKYAALIMVELILMYMCINHVGIYLSLFLVPIMSLLYCEKKTYLITSGVCYTCMVVCEALISHYTSSVRIDLNAFEWFVGIIGGMTIEYVIMFLAGYAINKVMIERLHIMYDDHVMIQEKEKQNLQDSMTGLWNKAYLAKCVEKYVTVQGLESAFIILDMDNFKSINDNFGHLEGDRAIITMAQILKDKVSEYKNAVVCRFGGDEFAMLIPELSDEVETVGFIRRLQNDLHDKIEGDEALQCLSMSIGVAYGVKDGSDYSTLFAHADNSVLYVKNHGKNDFHIYRATDAKQEEKKGR